MLGIEDFELWESAVFVHSGSGRNHDVENLHHGFLVSRGVVPSDWEKIKSDLATTYFSEISYGNGISLYMDERFLRVSQGGGLGFGEKHESVEFMIRYLDFVEKETLGGAILRWVLVAPHDDPVEWIGNRIVHPRIMEGDWNNLGPELTFNIDVQGRGMSLTFSTRSVEDESEEEQESISIVCSIRQDALGDNDELIKWLSGWREHEVFMRDFLGSLLGANND